MDFKNKFNSRNTQGFRSNSSNNNIQNANPFNNAFTNSSTKQNSRNTNIPQKQPTGGLNKFKKAPSKGAAPKGQFKKYLSQATNVFYQDRQELKQLQKIKLFKWGLFFVWFILAFIYFIIGRIQPYSGVCPEKATCGVFVHCPDLFQYDINQNQCKLSSDFVREFEEVAKIKIQKLHQDYAWQDCRGESGIPKFSVDQLLSELKDQQKVQHYKAAANTFFRNKKNQLDYGFEMDSKGNIIPKIKLYSLVCNISLFVASSLSFFHICCAIGGIVVLGYIVYRIFVYRRYSKMYEFLRDRVFQAQEKTLNITHTLGDLQTAFGSVNDKDWSKINDLRANDKKIGYYQDDFLYWKAT